jgi:hypothetical protein
VNQNQPVKSNQSTHHYLVDLTGTFELNRSNPEQIRTFVRELFQAQGLTESNYTLTITNLGTVSSVSPVESKQPTKTTKTKEKKRVSR